MDLETSLPKKTQLKGVIALLLTAFIWGISFVAQSVGMENVEAFTFNGIRTLMGAAILLPYILIKDRQKRLKTSKHIEKKKFWNKETLRSGTLMGIVYCAASNFQQYAFNYSTSGKIAFITATYIFFVPLLGLFLKKRVPLSTWISVLFVFIGLYFLCITPNGLGGINQGDLLAFVCAILFAIHILLVEKYALTVDGIKLAVVQFSVSGVISCLLMFLFETPKISAIESAMVPLLYSGILSCGIAYTLQIVGQRYTEATIASLVMCTESVFAALAAAIILQEYLTQREFWGCIIIFGAILLSQSEFRLPKKLSKKPVS